MRTLSLRTPPLGRWLRRASALACLTLSVAGATGPAHASADDRAPVAAPRDAATAPLLLTLDPDTLDPSSTDRERLAWSSDALRHLTLAQLESREATLGRRLRGYGVGLVGSAGLVAAGVATVVRNVCPFACSDPERIRTSVGTGLMLGGTFLSAVTLSGLVAAGTRRHRVRQRIRVLTFTPAAAWAGGHVTGGGSLALRW